LSLAILLSAAAVHVRELGVNSKVNCTLAIVSALTTASPVWAQNSTRAASQVQPNALDPNELICQKLEIIGSRLAVKKVCLTRSQWEDSRRQDRQIVERAQASPCVLTHNSGSGRPSC
jgi:hypothetical protein